MDNKLEQRKFTNETELIRAVKDLLVAVKFAGTKDYGGPTDPNICYEARVPIGFVICVDEALSKLNPKEE